MYYRPGPLVRLYYCYNIVKLPPSSRALHSKGCIICKYQATPTMTATLTAPVEKKYHGWANYETWNVSLWIQNSERLYKLSQWCDSYAEFIYELGVSGTNKMWTPNGVNFEDRKLNIAELDELFQAED